MSTKRVGRAESPGPKAPNGDSRGVVDAQPIQPRSGSQGEAQTSPKDEGQVPELETRTALRRALDKLTATVMKQTGGALGLLVSFGLCGVNVFTIVLTPVIVPFLIAAHSAREQGSFWSWNKHAVSFASALGCAVGSMALHYLTQWFGKTGLQGILPENLLNPTGQVAGWLQEYGAIGVGLSGFFPGPIQPAIVVGALLNCNGFAVGLCLFIGRYPKNFILFESASQAIHGTVNMGKKIRAKKDAE